MSQGKSPFNILYFHGKITRDRAEDLLMSQGAIEGMFLLRESVNGNFVISICHCNKVNHYNIEKQSDGTFQILTGRKFIGPIELVEHHMLHLDGFLTLARLPLERYPAGTSYYILQGVKSSFFEDCIKKKALEMGFKDSSSIEEVLNGPMRQHLKHMVLKDLHFAQPWFHHFLRRLEAEERLENAGHTEGQFLVRQRKGDPGFVLSISYQNQPKHYKIINKFDKLHIEGGQYFDSLIELIDHYYFRQDGLLCKLRFGVECPGFIRSKAEFFQSLNQSNVESAHSTICGMQNSMRTQRTAVKKDLSRIVTDKYRDMSINSIFRQKKSDMISVSSDLISFSEWSTNLPRLLNEPVSASLNNLNKELFYPNSIATKNVFQWNNSISYSTQSFVNDTGQIIDTPKVSENFITLENKDNILDQSLNEPQITDQLWSEPEITSSRQVSSPSLEVEISRNRFKSSSMPPKLQPWDLGILDPLLAVETQKIYDSLSLNDISFNLPIDKIEIKQKLGGGNFGYVYGGFYKINLLDTIPVAVKMLKKEMHSKIGAHEIMEEARTMSQLRHKHIVRLIGVCKCDQILLILELAPLGPINKYLRRNQSLSEQSLIELMSQVSRGMAYLEASKYVHRDLAARNVLLVNEHYAKISDFGMSKALNYGQDYYRAAAAGKWPLKWYAPECIYYFRFDSKSDVWSYGITLWEVFSYGERPYKDLKGTQILSMLDQGQRLSKPIHCPDFIYDVMLQCWSTDGVRRPTFAELVMTMSRIQAGLSTGIHEIGEQTNYLANSSGSSVAKTSYGSSECSRFPSPPTSLKENEIWSKESVSTNNREFGDW